MQYIISLYNKKNLLYKMSQNWNLTICYKLIKLFDDYVDDIIVYVLITYFIYSE